MEISRDRRLRQAYLRFERALRLICPGPQWRILAAVSGGCDSVVLAWLLNQAARRGLGTVIIGHVNHRLRPESKTEEAFVRGLARGWRLPFHVRRLSPRGLRHSDWSLEHAARVARLDALAAIATAAGTTGIALGHQMDDQAETILLRLLRGAGPRGLGAMAPRSELRPLSESGEAHALLRPLLGFRRDEIREIAQCARLEWMEDASNSDLSILRNRVRLELIPHITSVYNPRLVESLADFSRWQRMESEPVADDAARLLTEALLPAAPGVVTLDGLRLAAKPPAIASRALWIAYQRITGPEGVLGSRHVEELLAMLASLRGLPAQRIAELRLETHLPGQIVARLAAGRLVLARHKPRTPPGKSQPTPGGRTRAARGRIIVNRSAKDAREMDHGKKLSLQFNGQTFEISRSSSRPRDLERTDSAVFDWAALDPPLVVRAWKPGDSFVPYGMAGTKKVSDLLNERKVPRAERTRVNVVEDRRGILWVVGLRRSDRAPVSSATRSYLRIRILRRPESS